MLNLTKIILKDCATDQWNVNHKHPSWNRFCILSQIMWKTQAHVGHGEPKTSQGSSIPGSNTWSLLFCSYKHLLIYLNLLIFFTFSYPFIMILYDLYSFCYRSQLPPDSDTSCRGLWTHRGIWYHECSLFILPGHDNKLTNDNYVNTWKPFLIFQLILVLHQLCIKSCIT